MDSLFSVVLLGAVEGLTEFIPVSSTGHLILAGSLLGGGGKSSTFQIFIQLGAVIAVVVLYRKRFFGLLIPGEANTPFSGRRGLYLLILTTLPALLFGAAAYTYIKTHLFSISTVAWGLIMGALGMLAVERWRPRARTTGIETIGAREALLVGCFQILSLWPGVSRSASTIAGGMIVGVERSVAAEYSFLAAVPVLIAAITLDLYKNLSLLTSSDILTFAVGLITAFFCAVLAIQFFIRLLGRHTLIPFAWYRIALALFLFAYAV